MEMEMEMADECERVASATAELWNQLPDDLQIEVLAKLPIEMIERYRKVCHEWKTLLLSNYFLSVKWGGVPMDNKCLLLCDRSSLWKDPCMAFCFYTWTWKVPFSISELWIYTQSNWEIWNCVVNIIGSAAGLILASFPRKEWMPIVMNPYTKTSIQLPRMSSIRTIKHRCIIGNDNNTYHVVALGFGWWDILRGQAVLLVEIYDSCHKTWKVAGYIPWSSIHDLNISTDKDRMVFCHGCFYFVGDRLHIPRCILCFSVPAGSNAAAYADAEMPIPVLLAPLPELLPGFEMSWVKLVTCAGSRLIVVANIHVPINVILEDDNIRCLREGDGQVVLWEFQREGESWTWKEMATMPSEFKNGRRYQLSELCFNCIGVGNYVCFTVCRSRESMVAYNVRDNSWSCLPACPTNPDGFNRTSLAFEPGYHMSV